MWATHRFLSLNFPRLNQPRHVSTSLPRVHNNSHSCQNVLAVPALFSPPLPSPLSSFLSPLSSLPSPLSPLLSPITSFLSPMSPLSPLPSPLSCLTSIPCLISPTSPISHKVATVRKCEVKRRQERVWDPAHRELPDAADGHHGGGDRHARRGAGRGRGACAHRAAAARRARGSEHRQGRAVARPPGAAKPAFTARCCSPCHRMAFNSKTRVDNRMTCRTWRNPLATS
jgi:hypothetical protein